MPNESNKMSEVNDTIKSKENECGEALNEPGDDKEWGDEDDEEAIESLGIVDSKGKQAKIVTPINSPINDVGAASHDLIIEGRENYQMRQSFGIL